MSKVSAEAYVDKVNEIYREDPEYVTGKDGSNRQCDCIGMCRGALARAGATGVHNMRGTNNCVRNVDLNLQELHDLGLLKFGDIVMRTRDKDDKNMPLPDQYRVGGSEYDPKWGETNFTHIGSVTKVNPLEVTHMTDPHAKKDMDLKSLNRWAWYGQLPWVESGDTPGPGPEPPDPKKYAEVYAENGKPVKMRAKPSTNCGLYDELPVGTIVEVAGTSGDWTKVNYGLRKGWYIMSKFLIFGDEPSDEPDPVEPDLPDEQTGFVNVFIQGLSEEEADQLCAQYPGAIKTYG